MAELPDQDPIVQEIRQIRDDIAREFDYDAKQLGEYLRRRQRESGRTYVSGTPRPPRTDLMPKHDADAA